MIDPGTPVIFEGFKGVVENTLDIELSPKESPAAVNIETDKIDGILTKKLGFKQIGSVGLTLLLDSCESVSGWTFVSGCSGSADTAIPVVGTKSIKMTIAHATLPTGVAAYKTISASDFSAYAGIGFYVRSSVALNAGDYQFLISESASLATPSESLNIPALTAGVWQYVYLPFAGTTASRDAIVSYGIKIINDKGDLDYYLDNIDLVRTDYLPVDLCESAWTASANVISTADSSVIKYGTYSSKNVIAAGFTTGLIAYHNISSLDLSKNEYVGLWLRSTIALPAGSLNLLLDDTNGCGSPIETLIIKTALVKDTWTFCVVQLDTPAADTAILSVGLSANSDFGACTIYIDDIRASMPIVAKKEYIRTDGSRILMASNGIAVYKSTDAGATFTPIASGLNKQYYIWFQSHNGECFWGNGSDYNMKYDVSNNTVVYSATTGNAYYMPKARGAWVHQDTIFGLLYATDPITVRYNDPAKLSTEAGWFPAARSKDLQAETGDYLVCACAYGERSIIYLTKSFIVLSGSDHADFDWLPRNLGIGCTIRDSLQTKDGYAMFANEKGVYRMDESFVPQIMSEPVKNTYSKLAQPSFNYQFWILSTKPEFESGTYGNLIDTTSVPGKIMQKGQTTQADWQAGTATNVDLTTSPGDVLISPNQIPNGDFVSDLSNWNIPYGGWVWSNSNNQVNPGHAEILNIGFPGADFYLENNTGKALLASMGFASSWTLYTITKAAILASGIQIGETVTLTFVKDWTSSNYIMYQSFIYDGRDITFYYKYTYNATPIPGIYSFYVDTVKLSPNYLVGGDSSIITQTLNHGRVPSANGTLCAEVTIPDGCSIEFYGEARAADSGWGTYTLLGIATSTGNYSVSLSGISVFQYKQIKAVLKTNSDGTQTPILSSIYIGTEYLSVKHNIGTAASKWGQFLTNDVPNNQTIIYKLASATSSGGLDTATFDPIVPNTDITEPLANTWVQTLITLDSDRIDQLPTVDWFQLSWVLASTSTLPTTLLASVLYGRKYYLFGQLQGDNYNNTAFVLDKNWNWNILSNYPVGAATLFNESPFFGGSFFSGIGQLFSGNSFNFSDSNNAIESYWTTNRLGLESRKNNKWWKELAVFFEPVSSGTLAVYYDVGNTGVWSLFGTIDLTEGDGEARLLPISIINGRDIRLRFYNNGLNETFIIYKVQLFYEVYEDLSYF